MTAYVRRMVADCWIKDSNWWKKKSENGEQREGMSRWRKGKELWMQHSRSCQSWINPDVWEIKQMRVSACVRSYPLCFPKGLTHSAVPFSQIRRCQFSLLLYISYTYIRGVSMCGSQHLIWNFMQPNTHLSSHLSPVLCIASLFLYNVIMWREIRGGEGSKRLNEQLSAHLLWEFRDCCDFFFSPTTRSATQNVSTEVRFPSAAHPIHVCGRASASICACADSCMDVYQRGGVGERPRGRCWSWGEKEREGGQCAARWESDGGKKEKAAGKGETRRTQPLPIDAGGFGSGAPRSADTGRWSQ